MTDQVEPHLSGHARSKLAEARAILRSTRANLCPHGVRWRDCHQHPHDVVQGEVIVTTDQEGEPAT